MVCCCVTLSSNYRQAKSVVRPYFALYWVLKDIQQSFGIQAIGTRAFRVHDVDKLIQFVFQLAIEFSLIQGSFFS